MTDATRSQLEQAYRLIEQDDLEKAVAILKPIVAAQPDNADAWWLMANAVSEPQEARQPLENVLRLRPDHAEARQLLDKLPQEAPADSFGGAPEPFPADTSLDNLFGDSPEPSSSPSSVSSSELDQLLGQRPVPSGTEDLSFLHADSGTDDFSSFDMGEPLETPTDDLFVDPFAGSEPGFVADALGEEQKKADSRKDKRDKAAQEREKAEREREKQQAKQVKAAAQAAKTPLDPLEAERRFNTRPHPVALIALIVILVVVVGGGVSYVLLPRLLNQASAPSIPVTPGTAAVLVATTDVNTTLQATNDLFTANKFTEPKATIVQTSFGDTLQVQVCGLAGPKLLDDVNRAMDIVAQEASRVKDVVKAAGVNFVNCARTDSKLFTATAPIDSIVAYVVGGMSDKKTYRAAWKRG